MQLTINRKKDFENITLIAGVDEAGRGSLAGPLVVAAVVLGDDFPDCSLDDSKKLSVKKRNEFYEIIISNALAYSIEIVSHTIIDEMNVLNATLFGMSNSIDNLPIIPEIILVDGNKLPEKHREKSRAIIKGDSKYDCIAAASILAKVKRDQLMCELHRKFPMYGFEQHKGYGTKAHRAAIYQFQPSPFHRVTFNPVKTILMEKDFF